jgi:hypothetical protein
MHADKRATHRGHATTKLGHGIGGASASHSVPPVHQPVPVRTKIDKKKAVKVYHLLHEKYVPGVAQEVKDWLTLRRAYFNVRDGAKLKESIVSEIEYRIPHYWSGEIDKEWNPARFQEEDAAELDDDDNGVGDRTPLESFKLKLTNRNEYTPEKLLMEAVDARHTRFLDLFVEAGLDINIPIDEIGRTALHLVAFRGDLKKLDKLISLGSDVNAQDNRLDTPLHICLKVMPEAFKMDRICKHLLRNRADVLLLNRFNRSALHQACVVGDLRFIDPLLQAGSDVFALDIHGKLPLQYCKKQEEAVYIFSCHERPGWKRSRHTLMWSHILAREFVAHVFKLVRTAPCYSFVFLELLIMCMFFGAEKWSLLV